MPDFDSVLDAARQLPVSDRARLVDALWGSVADDDELPLDPEWKLELERRVNLIKSGTAATVSWADIRAAAIARLTPRG